MTTNQETMIQTAYYIDPLYIFFIRVINFIIFIPNVLIIIHLRLKTIKGNNAIEEERKKNLRSSQQRPNKKPSKNQTYKDLQKFSNEFEPIKKEQQPAFNFSSPQHFFTNWCLLLCFIYLFLSTFILNTGDPSHYTTILFQRFHYTNLVLQ